MYDVAYELLTTALSISYEKALSKYGYVQRTAYDKYLYEELALSCGELNKITECCTYYDMLIEDTAFAHRKMELEAMKLKLIQFPK
jgi:hypothetical protein